MWLRQVITGCLVMCSGGKRNYLKCVGETFESRMEGLFMVAFTRFPALGGGFRKKVKAVHQVITTDNPYVEVKYSEYINIQK